MKLLAKTLLSYLIICTLNSCVDNRYDIKELENLNTDINLGGSEFAMPIGSLQPIRLGQFIKPSDILSMVDGKYVLKYSGMQTVDISDIKPISINPTIPATDPLPVSLDDVSIDEIKLPSVVIDNTATVATPAAGVGSAVNQTLPMTGNSKITIGYTFTDQVKTINSVTFGNASALGDLIELNFTPAYGGAVNAGATTITNFSITFPAGFELGLPASNPYGATLGANNTKISISNKALQAGVPLAFYAKKLTFNPSVDQTTPFSLDYDDKVHYTGNFAITGTSTGVAGNVNVSLTTNKKLTLADGNFSTNQIVPTTEPHNVVVDINNSMDSPSVKSITSVTFKNSVFITLKMTIDRLPAAIPNIAFNNYQVEFPDFLVFKDPTLNATKKTLLNHPIDRVNGMEQKFEVVGFAFKENPVKGSNIVTKGNVIMKGNLKIPPSTLNNSEIKNISITPNVTMGLIEIKTVSGVIVPETNIKPFEIKVELGEDQEFLRNSTLDLTLVGLKMSAENNTGIAADIDFEIVPYDEQNEIISDGVVVQNHGVFINQQTSSKIWVANTEVGKPAGYSYVENKNMNKIFRKLPARFMVNMKANTTQHISTIDLETQDKRIDLDYQILAPFAIGAEFEIRYQAKVDDIRNTLSGVLDMVDSIFMNINAANTIPLDLTVMAVALDANSQPINVGIKSDKAILSGTAEGAAVVSNVILSLVENKKGELAKLDQIKLNFLGRGNKAVQGAVLRDDQTLTLRISAKIPNGITIKQ